MIIFYFLVFGAIIGSFLNVVIYRFHSEEGGIVNGRSHCRDCKTDLQWYDNIPLLSFLSLGGKCRYCRKGISWQYPLVELFTAICFVLAACSVQSFYGDMGILGIMIAACTALVFAAMIVVFVYDLKFMEVPMIAIWIAVFFAVSALVIHDYSHLSTSTFFSSHIFTHSITGLVAFLFFFGLSYMSDEKWMGYGDSFIALVVGLVLGPLAGFVGIVLAVWLGAFIGVALIAMRGKSMRSAIPFGPFLVGGMILSYAITLFAPQWLHVLW